MILCEYMLVYRIFVNTYLVVMTNAREHVNTILSVISHYASDIILSFNRNKLYLDPDPILQVSNVLIYPDVIFLNIINNIGQDLMKLFKTGMYRE